MVLVDSSVWIDHFRNSNHRLVCLLDEGEVICHPFIIGELACGHIVNRMPILTYLRSLPQVGLAGHFEALSLIESHELMGQGLGYIDVHLLASARLAGVPIWSKDIALKKAAAKLGVLLP